MQSYPFTSDKITYDEHGLPKYDRAVDSAFLRKVFAQYFSDGVFYSSANALQVVADTGMQVAVEPGSCHIQGAIGIETNRRTLVVQAAEEMDRIDTVVARLDLSLAVRSIDLYVVKGTAAESPQAPALTRDSTIWELGLANLFVAKNVTTISQQRITDTRLDTSRCGQVGAPVQPPFDTEAFFSQLEAAIQAHQEDAEAQIEQLRNAIEAVEGDAAWMMKEHYDPAGLGKDITVQTYTHSKSGTVHEFTGTGANGRAKMTADVQAGDTFTVNGAPVTAYMGTDDAAGSMAGSAWNGKWVSFIVEGGTLNFKGGGGKVTVTGLTADAVKKGTTVTVKQGAKVVASVSGTMTYGGACVAPTIMAHCALGQYASDNGFLSFFPLGFISDGSFRISGNQLICDVAGTYNIQCSVQKKNSWTFAYGVDLRLNGSNIDTDPIASSFQRTLNKGDYFQFYYHVSTDENGTNAAAVACLKIDRVG
ncbi:hypothetical protein [Candidatus Allofournierella merdipullorum]|uniref:hypothetical protein n=1 Tax=Candidatus Allofournierella merdipullorum TaxID=2838595 RepID=UPI00374FB5BE